MASIFDYSNYGMSPEEIAAMEAEVSKQRPYINPNKLPSTVNKGMGPVIGDYIPADQPVGSRTAGLLTSDPVSTQYGSRVNPNAGSGTMYGGRGGNVSPDIDAARTKPGASTRWVPPGEASLFNTSKSAADWTPPAEGRPLLKEAAKGASALSKFAKVAGPAGFIYDAANPEMLGDGELTKEQQAMMARNAVQNMGPEKAGEAVQFGSDVAQRTLDAGLGRNQGVSLMDPNSVPQPPEEAPAVQETPVGPVTQAAPATVPQAAAKTAQDMETQRQVVEQGALKGLSTGAVSRPEFAQEIAKQDAQKAGVTLTPEQLKSATAVELTNMKSMDNNEVSRYISYALAAAGVLATVFDKSGKAGDAFSASFNKQLDRNLQGGLAAQKNAAAAAKQAQDLKIALANIGIRQQVANTGERAVENTAEYRDRSLDQREQLANASNALGYYRVSAADRRAGAANSLAQQRLDQDAEQFNRTFGLREEDSKFDRKYKTNANAIRAAAAAGKGGAKGIDVTTKDAQGLVDAAVESQGLNVDKAAKSAIAQTVRIAAKNNPDAFARDPNGVVLGIIRQKNGPYQQSPGTFLTDPTIKQRKLKQQ
jgi:hypothetical protein